MANQEKEETAQDLADRLDAALARFWNGSSRELDELVEGV